MIFFRPPNPLISRLRPLVLLACVFASRGVGSAHGADACAVTPPGVAACMAPSIADVVLVIDHAAELAGSPRGRAAVRVLQDVGLFADSAIAWNELAAALGMNPEDALRAIAGQRIMLIVRAETVDHPTSWALITHVASSTERLVRERLKPVPKRIAGGQPVLMLENGRFLLATRAERGSRDHSGDATILIASAHASDLFDACLPLLVGKPAAAPISADPLASLASVPAQPDPGDPVPDAFMILRPRTSGEPDAPRTILTVLCAPSADFEEGWSAIIASTPDFLGEPANVAQRGIPEPLFRSVSDHAILAFAAPVSSTRDGGSGFARILYRFMADVAPLFVGQGVVALRERPSGPDGAPSLELLVGSALTPDPEVKTRFDEGMSTLINRLTRAKATLAEAHDFEGRFPRAVREADLTQRSLSLLGPLIGPSPVARWCFAEGGGEGESPWWLAQVADRAPGSDGSALRAVAASLTPDPDDPLPESFTTIGLIRPDAMYRVFPQVLRTVTPFLAPLRTVRSIEWRAALGSDGLVRGSALLRFVAEPSAPPDPRE